MRKILVIGMLVFCVFVLAYSQLGCEEWDREGGIKTPPPVTDAIYKITYKNDYVVGKDGSLFFFLKKICEPHKGSEVCTAD